jgi:uncharacterized protein YbjT (DUF2867 family)
MPEARVLVAGATGQLGSVIVRKLLTAGVPVRALARTREKLAPLEAAGAEIAPVNLLDVPATNAACRGVGQIIATANNNMGHGETSPRRIDLPAYQNLCAAARSAGVRRLLFVSTPGAKQDAIVDLFRVKWYIEDAIRRSGVPYVTVHASAFMDIWVDMLMADGIRKKNVATIFGDGTRASNYISVDDLAEFIVKILAREDVKNETVPLGGPSDISGNDLATLVEKRIGTTAKRRHIPVAAMKYLSPVVRPFNEVAARLMTLGLYAATAAQPLPGWKTQADRFGVVPMTIEKYVEKLGI